MEKQRIRVFLNIQYILQMLKEVLRILDANHMKVDMQN